MTGMLIDISSDWETDERRDRKTETERQSLRCKEREIKELRQGERKADKESLIKKGHTNKEKKNLNQSFPHPFTSL